jgi:hypothetical protein
MRLAVTLLLAGALLAQNPPTSAPPASSAVSPSPQDDNARKARALLEQTIQALGGSAYLNYQDMYQEGRYSSFYEGRPSGVGNVFARYWKWPDKERLEMFNNKEWVVLYVGDQGYDTTFRGTRLVDREDLADYLHRRDHSLEVVLRRWLPDPGTALFYEGSALVELKPVEKVSLINSANDSVTLYLDAYSHLPIKKTYQVRDPVTRLRDEEGEIYDHYKLIQGIQTPVSLVRLHNGQMTRQLFVRKVQYNLGTSDALFTPPPLNYDRTKK